jgi:hypothetical protein
MQAVRDYFDKGATTKGQATILRELRSEWMDYLTNGMSASVADQLEKNPKIIAERLNKMPKEG